MQGRDSNGHNVDNSRNRNSKPKMKKKVLWGLRAYCCRSLFSGQVRDWWRHQHVRSRLLPLSCTSHSSTSGKGLDDVKVIIMESVFIKCLSSEDRFVVGNDTAHWSPAAVTYTSNGVYDVSYRYSLELKTVYHVIAYTARRNLLKTNVKI